MMRFSTASLGEEPTPRFIEQVKLAELLGYDAFFHADEKWTRDVYVRLAQAAAHATRIGLGISVTDPFTRHPALTAQAAATLAEASQGRLRLVLGAGSHFETLPGYRVRKPAVAIREAIELMRRLWAGERVTMDGEIVKFRAGRLDFDPEVTPPIYVAGRGPKVLETAGAVADGVLIGSFATEWGLTYARTQIARGLQRAGRTWADIATASWVYVSVLDAEDEPVPEDIRRGVSHALWSSREFLRGMLDSLIGEVPDDFRRFLDRAPHEWSPEVMAELRSLIPRSLIDALAIVGTEDQLVHRFRALEALGVQECVMWPFPREGEDVEDVLIRLAQRVIPRVRGRLDRGTYRRVD